MSTETFTNDLSKVSVRVAGSWNTVDKVFCKINNVHKLSSTVWVKNNGSWIKVFNRTLPNYVILRLSLDGLTGGYTVLSDYNEKYPMGDSTGSTTTGGAATHAGSSHGGSNTANTSTYSHPKNSLWKLFPNNYVINNTYHYHSIAHTHNDNPSNLPITFRLIPVVSSKGIIPKDSIILYDSTVTPSGWIDVNQDYSSKYLRFSSTTSGIGSEYGRHSHSYSGYSGIHYGSIKKDTWTGSTMYYRHKHSISHTHPEMYNTPIYISLRILQAEKDKYFSELPVGTVLAVTVKTLPGTNWSYFTPADNRLIKLYKGARTTGGTTTHTIATSSHYTGYWTNVASIRSKLESTKNRYFEYNHRHTMNHGHNGAVNWMPPYKRIVLIRKDS